MKKYSQFRAMAAITRASLIAIFRSPSAVIFSFAFPFVFILVFGFIGNGSRSQVFRIALASGSDTANEWIDSLRTNRQIRIISFSSEAELRKNLNEGKITGVLSVKKSASPGFAYTYSLRSTTASGDKWPQLLSVLSQITERINQRKYPGNPTFARQDFIYDRDIETVREYTMIDFILPGQLGFSLLSSGVFGVAFMFFNLRTTLVLKRFFATPVSRTYIILGEGLARILFQMLTAVVIILVGRYFFDFTLVNGFLTFADLLILSFIGLIVFMGFGFVVSGIATSDSTIPPLANLITLPQFLLGGTFFSVDLFPKWLQPIAHILPLTHLNDALRAVAFEGQTLWEVRSEIGILFLWGAIVYFAAVKLFKWE